MHYAANACQDLVKGELLSKSYSELERCTLKTEGLEKEKSPWINYRGYLDKEKEERKALIKSTVPILNNL